MLSLKMGNSPRYLASPSARGFTLLASVIGREYTEGMQRIASWSALYLRLALRALVRPRLAVDLLRLAWSFRARDWYRRPPFLPIPPRDYMRSEEHTSELQSLAYLVCRLLLEKKKRSTRSYNGYRGTR